MVFRGLLYGVQGVKITVIMYICCGKLNGKEVVAGMRKYLQYRNTCGQVTFLRVNDMSYNSLYRLEDVMLCIRSLCNVGIAHVALPMWR